jgi:RNA polymerase sigma-70 factor, ECF subfamily
VSAEGSGTRAVGLFPPSPRLWGEGSGVRGETSIAQQNTMNDAQCIIPLSSLLPFPSPLVSPPKDSVAAGQLPIAMQDADRAWRERGLRSAVLAGDERAWQSWYDATFAELHRYVCWRCAGMRDLADDMVQETWLTAVRRIRAFDPDQASFAAWLRGIAANVIRNHLRSVRRVKPTAPLDGSELAPATGDRADKERIAQALAALSERHEAVLRAKYLDQRSVADIAAEWADSPKAVESLLTRAREAFREAYLKPNP